MNRGRESEPRTAKPARKSFYNRPLPLWQGVGIGAAGTIATAALGVGAFHLKDSFPSRVLGNEQSTLRLQEEGPSQEVITELLRSVMRLNTSVPKEYLHYGYTGGDCTGFVVQGQDKKPLVLTAQHCAPEIIQDKNGDLVNTRIPQQGSVLRIQARVGQRNEELTSTRFYSLVTRPLIDRYDVVGMTTTSDVLINLRGIPLSSQEKLQPGQHATLLSRDAQNNPTSSALYNIGSSKEDGLVLLALTNLDKTCAVGQSGSPIVDNKGKLLGIFTNTEANPFKLSASDVAEYNLPLNFIGVEAKICYGVGLPAIKEVVGN